MKSMMFVLVPVICLWGCGDPGPATHADAGEDAAESGTGSPDSSSTESGADIEGGNGSVPGCDCYTCPYGSGCRPSTTQPPPNPTTVKYPHGNTQM